MSKRARHLEIMTTSFQIGRLLRKQVADLKHPKLEHPLTSPQMYAIHILEKHASTMGELADEMNISFPSATSLVDRLVAAELVTRSLDPDDRRIIRITPTAKAKKMMKEMEEIRLKAFNELLENMSEDDQEALLRILKNVQTSLKQQQGKE